MITLTDNDHQYPEATLTAMSDHSEQRSKTNDHVAPDELEEQAIRGLTVAYRRMRQEIGKVIIGQDEVVDQLLIAMFCKGHCLLVGVPGLAKTLLCSTIASILQLAFRRIQFTPDLMPSDITGTDVLQDDIETGRKAFQFIQGPLFTNVLLADEINRTPPKTQAALLEAMQERNVTVGSNTFRLPDPFFTLATQNPIEQEGVYRLPEAQLDRFLFRIEVGYPQREQEVDMLDLHSRPTAKPQPVTDAEEIVSIQRQLDTVYGTRELQEYIIDLVRESRKNPDLLLGASPRAAINLMKAGRAHALMSGRSYLTHEDVQAVSLPVLGHRLIMRPEAEMDGRSVNQVVDHIIKSVPVLQERHS